MSRSQNGEDIRHQFIDWFRDSTQYINSHRGQTFVISLSGEALADGNLNKLICDLSLLHSLGVKLVVVHGARPQISAALKNRGITSDYHRNLRITSDESIATVKQVIGELSADLDALFSLGIANTPMHGADIRLCRGNFVTAKPVGILDGIDFHFTGKVRKVNSSVISQQLNADNLVLISNLGYSLTGEVFNLSAEEVATQVAIALQADKLIMFTPHQGVRNAQGGLVKSLGESETEAYIEALHDDPDENISATRYALEAALCAYRNKVHRSHLISYRENGALLQELFTREGSGTLLSSDNFEKLRAATIADVSGIVALLKPLEQDGTLVTRSRELLENEIENFSVITLESTIIACAALYVIGESGEIAAVASHPEYQGRGLGERLVAELEENAKEQGLTSVFALTTVTSHWFQEKGYTQASIEALPTSRQALYNFQRNSKVFLKQLIR